MSEHLGAPVQNFDQQLVETLSSGYILTSDELDGLVIGSGNECITATEHIRRDKFASSLHGHGVGRLEILEIGDKFLFLDGTLLEGPDYGSEMSDQINSIKEDIDKTKEPIHGETVDRWSRKHVPIEASARWTK